MASSGGGCYLPTYYSNRDLATTNCVETVNDLEKSIALALSVSAVNCEISPTIYERLRLDNWQFEERYADWIGKTPPEGST